MSDDTKSTKSTESEADSKKTETGQTQSFDTSHLGDEDFEKIFDDPRLWKHSRFKQLRERAKKAEDYESDQQKQKEAKLLEEKKFQELVDEKQKQIEKLTSEINSSKADNRILQAAQKLGAVDGDAVLRMLDRSTISTDASGAMLGVDEAVKGLLEAKPYLKGKGTSGTMTIGNGTSPGTTMSGPAKFKLSQLQDSRFYTANEKEITEAMKNNQIEDDVNR